MFQAIMVVCAATLAGDTTDPCILFEGATVKTVEICKAGLEEFDNLMDTDEMFRFLVELNLGNPPMLSTTGVCEPVTKEYI
jgi:hypothetical protein